MRFDVITLFPEIFAPFLAAGVTNPANLSVVIESSSLGMSDTQWSFFPGRL